MLVVAGGQRAHGVEQQRHGPVHLLAAAGEHDVLLAHLDQLGAVADAVGAGRAGRADGVVDALDLERRRQAGRVGAGHGARHHVRPDAAQAFLPQRIGGQKQIFRGGAPRAHEQSRPRIRDLIGFQARVVDGLLHGDIVERRALSHEAQNLAIDVFLEIQANGPVNGGPESELHVLGAMFDPGTACVQGFDDFPFVVADAGDDAQAGDDDAPHSSVLQKLSVDVNSPTRKSLAV